MRAVLTRGGGGKRHGGDSLVTILSHVIHDPTRLTATEEDGNERLVQLEHAARPDIISCPRLGSRNTAFNQLTRPVLARHVGGSTAVAGGSGQRAHGVAEVLLSQLVRG